MMNNKEGANIVHNVTDEVSGLFLMLIYIYYTNFYMHYRIFPRKQMARKENMVKWQPTMKNEVMVVWLKIW